MDCESGEPQDNGDPISEDFRSSLNINSRQNKEIIVETSGKINSESINHS